METHSGDGGNDGTKVWVRPLPHPWHRDMSEVQTRRYRRRSSRSRRREIRAAAISVISAFVVITAFAAAVLFLEPLNDKRVVPLTAGAEAVIADDVNLEAARDESSRTVYPYSVVPGGVYSPEELAKAVASDPAVSAHYGDVTPAAFHVENVNGSREAYMSYRIGDAIYWTKRKLALHDGERVLSDGSVTLRARCGNQLSDEPRQPTSDAEPPVQAFEDAPAAPVAPPPLPLAAAPPLEPGMEPISSPDPWDSIPYLGGIGAFALDSFRSPLDDETLDSSEDDGTDPPIAFVIPSFTGGGDGHYSDEGPVIPQVPGLATLNPPSDDHPPFDGPPHDGPPLDRPRPPGGGSDGELPPPVVPEPTSITLFGTGAVWLALKRYRARKP